MKKLVPSSFVMLLAGTALTAQTAAAQLAISEVHSAGSGTAVYAADWFEVRNTGLSAINLTGWKMDDGSASFAASVALRGVTSLAPGQFAIFLESSAPANDAGINSSFLNAWFGSSAPAGLLVGNYGGSGIGLSTGGDGVNLFDAGGTLQTGVSFGAATTGFTFDNAAGLGSGLPLSAVGVNSAFTSLNGQEVGSPGVVPEPTALSLGALGLVGLIFRSRLVARR